MVSEKFTIENQLALIKDENERLITDLRRKMILQ